MSNRKPCPMKQIRVWSDSASKQGKPDEVQRSTRARAGLLRRDSRKVEGNMAHNYALCIFRGKKEKTVGMDKMEYGGLEGPLFKRSRRRRPPRPPRAECTRPMSVVGHPATHGRDADDAQRGMWGRKEAGGENSHTNVTPRCDVYPPSVHTRTG